MAEPDELEAERASLEASLARSYQVPPLPDGPLATQVERLRAQLAGAAPPRRVFSGIKIAVDRVSVEKRGGGSVDKDVVTHPGSVVILPVLDDGGLVLIRNARVAVGRWLLELPAGTLEPGEDPRDCAVRELLEETGYEAEVMEPLLSFFPAPGTSSERMHAFVARGLRAGGGQRLEATERIEVLVERPERALARIAAGEIEDGKTIAVTLFYLRR